MDGTDFEILTHLVRAPFDRVEAVARAVGLSRNAVARRLRAMEASPLRLQYFALPHPSLFGLRSHVFLFHTALDSRLPQLIGEGPVMAYDLNHDGLCAVTVWSREADPSPPAALVHSLGAAPIARYRDATPGPRHPVLSRLEWKMVLALLDRPRGTAKELASATGLAAPTCARHRTRLFEKRYIAAGVTFQEDRSGGFPVFRVYVQGQVDADRVLGKLGSSALISDSVEEGKVFLGRAASLGQVLSTVDQLRSLPGVSDVKLILSRGNGLAWDWIRSLCTARMAAVGSPARAAAA